MEPSVSVPIAKPTSPAAAADAGPADEPLEPCATFHGFFVVPPNQMSPCASALHHRGVDLDDLVAIWTGAPRGLVALHRQEVLRSPRYAVERTAILPARDLLVRRRGLTERSLLRDRDDRLQHRVEPLDAAQVHPRELRRRHLPTANQLGELGHGKERELLQIVRYRSWRHTAADRGALRRQLERDPGWHRIEVHGGRDGVVQGDGVQLLDLRRLALQPIHHLLALLVAELETRDLFCAGDRGDGDLLTAGGPSPQHAWQERAPEADGGEVAEELPAVVPRGDEGLVAHEVTSLKVEWPLALRLRLGPAPRKAGWC